MLIGCDLNSKSVALCVLNPDWQHPSWQKITVKVRDRAQMLGELHSLTMEAIFPGDVVYVESPVLAGVRNIQSTIKVAAAYGAVLAAINQRHAVAIEVPVSLWKVATIGRGNASKSDIAEWLHSTHPDHHRACDGDQDLMDATCIALYGELTERSAVAGGRGALLHQAAVQEHPGHRSRRD